MHIRGGTYILIWSIPALLLGAPAAAALEASGSLFLEGPTTFPAGTTLRLNPIVALDHDTADLDDFQLEAAKLRVTMYENRYVGSPGNIILRSTQTEQTWTQTDATLRLLEDGNHDGYLAIRSEPNAALSTTLGAAADIESRTESRIETEGVVSDSRSPSWFLQNVTGAHLYLDASLVLVHDGGAAVKLNGPDFELTAAENSTPVEWRTGRIEVSPVEVVIRWFWIEAEEARVQFASGRAPVEIVATHAPSIRWNGEASLHATAGSLDALDGRFLPSGERASLVGLLAASLAPGQRPGASDLTNVQGQVDVQSTTLLYQPSALAPLAPLRSSWWGPLLVGGIAAVAATGGTGLVMWQRNRRRQPPMTVDECSDYTLMLLESGDFVRALEWARRGRRMAPDDPQSAYDEARCLEKQGDVQGALRAYAAAHNLAVHGDFALAAARLLQARGSPPEAIQDRLVAALDKSPELLLEIECEFPQIARRPTWADVTRTARLMSR